MSSLAYQRTTILQKARELVDRAQKANRDLTADEVAEVESAIEQVEQIDRKAQGVAAAKSVLSLGNYDQSDEDPDAASGGWFTPEAKAGIAHAVKSRTTYRTQVDAKAAMTTGTMLPTSGQGVVAGLHPNVYPLASLFANEQAAGPVVRYYRTTAGSAGIVAEGALKPDAGIAITPVDLALVKIAALAQLSDETFEDAPFVATAVENELRAAVAQAENQQIVSTFAGTSGVLTGSATNATIVDSIADAIAGQEALSGLTPNAVIAHPSVVATIRKTKASTAGVYVLDPTQAGPTSIYGTPVVSTPVVGPTTVWVVESSGVTIFRRGAMTVDVGTNADDWAHNITSLRAEERMGTAVRRVSCLTEITLS